MVVPRQIIGGTLRTTEQNRIALRVACMLNGLIFSEVSITEKLPLEKKHTYLIIFLRTGQVQNNFYCTIILTYDLRFNT